MAQLRIICGPTKMRVERNGVVSREVAIGAADGPAECRVIALELWREIRAVVSFQAWVRHRLRMAAQRRLARCVAESADGGAWHPGPRPDLVSTVPWAQARAGQWVILPPGVAARILRKGR